MIINRLVLLLPALFLLSPGMLRDSHAINPAWWYQKGAVDSTNTVHDSRIDILLDAESPTYFSPGVEDSFVIEPITGASGNYICAEPNDGDNVKQNFGNAPVASYDVNLPAPGTYYIWVRMYGASGSDDSVHVGIDHSIQATSDRIHVESIYGQWRWTNATLDGVPASFTVSTAGPHSVQLIMREDGAKIDALALTRDATLSLSDSGLASDFSAVNQGQLKNMAKAAREAMDDQLPGGAGAGIAGMIDAWNAPTASTSDFAALNLGQLKTVAKPFYDRLIATGIAPAYPWSGGVASDYAMANAGQLKNLFNFDPSTGTAPISGNNLHLARFWNRELISDGSRYALVMDTAAALGFDWTYENGGDAWETDATQMAALRALVPNAKIFVEVRWYSVPDNFLHRIPGYMLGAQGEVGPGWSNYYLNYDVGGFKEAAGNVARKLVEMGVDGVMLDWNNTTQTPSQLPTISHIVSQVHSVPGANAKVLANINDQPGNAAANLCDNWDCEQPKNSYLMNPWDQSNINQAELNKWHGIVRACYANASGLDTVRFFVYDAQQADWLYSMFSNFHGQVKFQFEQYFPNPWLTNDWDVLDPKIQYEPSILSWVTPLPL